MTATPAPPGPRSAADGGTPAAPAGAARPPRPGRAPTPWWRRPWIVPLALVTVLFLAYSLPPYLTFDPATSRMELREDNPLHYPLIIGHILFGTVALATCCLQVWPWLRRRHPAVHRWSGRLYVFAGVLPGAPLALAAAALGQQGLAQQAGNAMSALLWFCFAVAGWRAARRRDFADHREWMVRGFALTFSIVANRPWLMLCVVLAEPQLETMYGGNEQAMIQAAAAASVWLSWVVNLLAAEWWLRRRRRPARPRRVARV
ncbi:DUF2306 domain-containing protein [Streptomonospora nanhaiensis]|uniref:DUF2306 domain-containing protein n=1 Tax=Streptomonospora nanhaiensis TaxID=1323731 RepID=UPI001C393FF8|nr:DUF2306 domain-containing protein [Streptomonospora nanhaiensis]MBV2363760.1 DUF2306 domain-containing protein [Streptomonospora nanhaiensis]